MKAICILLILAFTSCNNVEPVTYDNKTDTSARSLDGSATGDSTLLPHDSTKTGVQH